MKKYDDRQRENALTKQTHSDREIEVKRMKENKEIRERER